MRILCLRIKNYSFNITRYKVTKIWKYSFIKLEFMDISHFLFGNQKSERQKVKRN